MMNREIKFRIWSPKINTMLGWDDVKWMMSELLLTETETNIPMQFTGMKDKNGREIYEGDIIYGTPNMLKMVVVWYDSFWCIKYLDCGTEHIAIYGDDSVSTRIDSEVEAIGNIYENPELYQE